MVQVYNFSFFLNVETDIYFNNEYILIFACLRSKYNVYVQFKGFMSTKHT